MDLFASLKEETAVEHQALEDQLDLMRAGLTRERYIETLQHFLGYVEPYERALQGSKTSSSRACVRRSWLPTCCSSA